MLLAILLVAGCRTSAAAPPAPAGTSGAGSRHASADVAFVQALIPHHEQGIALASAAARAPAARTLAEAIIATQRDEVVRMSGWLREWSATAPPSAGPPPATKDPIRSLIAHQEEAIKLAQREQAGGTNPAALAFARQVVESRTEEIAQLRTYLG
jgi:uncharacterized protein (DUF305 family)